MSKVWLITGSGNGLGRGIAEAALAAGDSVVAGAAQKPPSSPKSPGSAQAGASPLNLAPILRVNRTARRSAP